MSIGLTHPEEKQRDSTAKQSKDERGPLMRVRMSNHISTLSALFEGVEASVPSTAAGLEIRQVTCDSRKVQPQALFFALHGAKVDGNAFLRDAVSRVAVAIASEDAPPAAMPPSVAWIRVRQPRKPLAITAGNLFWSAPNALALLPVTGTT